MPYWQGKINACKQAYPIRSFSVGKIRTDPPQPPSMALKYKSAGQAQAGIRLFEVWFSLNIANKAYNVLATNCQVISQLTCTRYEINGQVCSKTPEFWYFPNVGVQQSNLLAQSGRQRGEEKSRQRSGRRRRQRRTGVGVGRPVAEGRERPDQNTIRSFSSLGHRPRRRGPAPAARATPTPVPFFSAAGSP